MVWMAFSRAFRTPTLLKSTDRQWGQRGENTPYSSAFHPILLGFLRFSGIAGQGRPWICVAAIRATYRPGHGNLFGCPHVRLGKANILLGAGNLPLMPFRKSLVHTPSISLSAIHRGRWLCPVPLSYQFIDLINSSMTTATARWSNYKLACHAEKHNWKACPRPTRAAGRNILISPFRSFRSTRSIR